MTFRGDGVRGRWDSYTLAHGSGVPVLWEQLRIDTPGDTLFVLARGFDPRMCAGLASYISVADPTRTDVILLEYPESDRPPGNLTAELRAKNDEMIAALGQAVRSLKSETLPRRDRDSRRVAARAAARLMPDAAELSQYRHVLVDISALPRTVYFPLIGRLLEVVEQIGRGTSETAGPVPVNVHLLVNEDASLDSRIHDEGIGELAEYLPGFTGGLDREATADVSTIWIPLLGEMQGDRLRRIYTHVNPAEICPVLPSPSRLPRRADNMVLEYHDLLFDQLRVEPRNILYASERNPFEVYRQLRKTVLRYESALNPIGGCKTALSALSSKLMSVGALLAAYELKRDGHLIGVAHVESESSSLLETDAENLSKLLSDSELFDLWLVGEAYAH